MAEALLEVVAENLVSLIRNEVATFYGVNREIKELSSTLDLIKAVIEDAEQKQIPERSIKVWLQQLKDAVYVLDDILDECSIRSHRLGGSSSFNPTNVLFRYGVGKRLKEIKRRLDKIAEDRKKFGLLEGVRERPIEAAECRQTCSVIDQPQLYGRDEDKEKIVEFLLSPARGFDFLSVYPIVGLGGVGKTTLTQYVYNDERVSTHFNLKIWVCVSEDFNVKRILCSIIESITREKSNLLDLDPVQKSVQELLQSKRYLLVLDDVWKRNQKLEFGLSQDKWDKLQSVLRCGSKGSSILVSTRDMDVAAIMGTCPDTHQLSGLAEDDCWLLFKQRAFGPDKEERAELVAIGKEIVKKCGGSPLAAKALGGLLQSKHGEKEWLEVKESKLWTLPDEDSILPALRLSYFYLTPTLRLCFAFCAIFPKDKEIRKEDLIHLWMANGFISSRENLDVEDVGNAVWNELHQKSFFQDIKTYDFGKIHFKMHDLVHDLALSVTGQECLILENNANMTNLSNIHHVGFAGDVAFSKEAFEKVESLRTLFMLHDYGKRISGWFPTNQSLRVLSTNSLELSSLRNCIHLRYLKLCDLDILSLPDSIYNLRKLEILKLEHLPYLVSLPKHLTRLQNLRHFYIIGCHSLSRMSPNIGKLSCLRTLSVYIVSSETGHSLAELRDLKLGGSLSINGLEYVGSLSEAEGANLMAKKDLQHLWLSWGWSVNATHAEQVLQALHPHSDLKRLEISQYEGLHFPSWMINNSVLSSLVQLEFYNCKNCLQLSGLGKLPSLRELVIFAMDHVQYMDDDESYDGVAVRAFQTLERLELQCLPNLERLLKVERGEMLLKVERGEMFPRLVEVSINDCPKLQLPCLPSVKELGVCGCNNELLRSVSSLSGLTSLRLHSASEDMTSLPEGMIRNLTCLKRLDIQCFRRLKEFPHEIMNLNALEHLYFFDCEELETFPEQVFECLLSLRTLRIFCCEGLRSLPEAVRHLTSLELLEISSCPTLEERYKEGTGEDWHKIAHIPSVRWYPQSFEY